VIDRGSTAGGPHLNGGYLRCADRLRRYARLHSCFVYDLGDGITSRGSTKGKLFTSLPENKIVEREDVISWS
jgi:hypothetical protein